MPSWARAGRLGRSPDPRFRIAVTDPASTFPAYIGLGSNLDDPLDQIARALAELDALPATRLVARSGLYRNPPMGPADQPDFVNAAAKLMTALEPLPLLDALLRIEAAHRRRRTGARWGPRTLDLDLLLYDDRVVDHPRLQLPHPGLPHRVFVLVPLCEIEPELVVTGHGRVCALAAACDRASLSRLPDAGADA